MTAAIRCIACGMIEASPVAGTRLRCGVTSDCKPWPRCGEVLVFEQSGHVQKRQDAQWQADVARIYGEYEMYVLTGGSEQVIFQDGAPSPRTQCLLECMRERVSLPAAGSMLDVGCGNGSTMRTFGKLYP